MKVTKVHKILQFHQAQWLKEYIDFNTDKRSKSKTEFEKSFFKLMNNAVFGKTMENVRNRIDFELVTCNNKDEEKVEHVITRHTRKPRYKRHVQFSETCIGIETTKSKCKLDKPIYAGFSILDLSKVLMYDFHYNTMRKKYSSNCKLLFTDTDSLFYEITTDNLYNDYKEMMKDMDFSDYPKEHSLYDVSNKKVIGKFKDEANGQPISEFVGLKSKMYSYTIGDDENKRLKGIKTSVVKNEITHSNYLQCIEDDNVNFLHKMRSIRSENHQLYSIEINKSSLNSYDDKSYYLDSKTSRRHGHYLNQ